MKACAVLDEVHARVVDRLIEPAILPIGFLIDTGLRRSLARLLDNNATATSRR
jgi:hypothetical protein